MEVLKKLFARKIWLVVLLVVLVLTTGVWANARSANRLSPSAEQKLSEFIGELAGSTVDYQVLSVKKAPGPAEQDVPLTSEVVLSNRGRLGACPSINGGEELFCVVLDQPVISQNGEPFSHFLLTYQVGRWSVTELADDETGVFAYVGCNNWEVR